MLVVFITVRVQDGIAQRVTEFIFMHAFLGQACVLLQQASGCTNSFRFFILWPKMLLKWLYLRI